MSDLRQAAQQVLDAWQTSLYGKPSHQKAVVLAMTNLNIVLQQQAEPVHGDIRTLKYRIHELEGEVMGYKRMLDVAEAASQPQQQAEPVFENLEYVAVVYSPSNAMLKSPLPIGTHLYKYPPQRKPLTDGEFAYVWHQETRRIMGTDKALLLRAKQITEAAHGIKEGT